MRKFDNNMTGALFPKHNKPSEKHPDHTGKCIIDGVEFAISAWEKRSASGPYVSLAFKMMEKEKVVDRPRQKTPTKEEMRSADDDVPF